MERSETTVEHLSGGVPSGTDSIRTLEAGFSERYPGGFAPISKVADGDYFEYDPLQIVETTQFLDDSEFELYLDTIISWWCFSYDLFTLQYDGREILDLFVTHDPEAATWLGLAAAHNNSTLWEWVGLQGRQQ